MFDLTPIQMVLSVVSGLLVGFSLGLIGGGGSILAIPLLIYFVGYDHPHIVIGTTALAVGINALLNLIPHFRKKNVNFKVGSFFSVFGIIGVLVGTEMGLLTPGKDLLFIFAILMIVIAILMLRRKCINTCVKPEIKKSNFKIALYGLFVGFASGYFGIGGGFLIVPALIYSAGLNILQAIGTSLISVGLFGLTTATRYAISGDLNIIISVLYIIGGIAGGWIGASLAHSVPKRTLTKIFAIIIILVAIYMIYMNITVLMSLIKS